MGLTGHAVDGNRDGVAGIVYLHRLAGTVGLVHRQAKPGSLALRSIMSLELTQADLTERCMVAPSLAAFIGEG